VLGVHGEQGSGKSTLARMHRDLVDPNKAPLRSAPRDERDLMIAANNSWLLCYDNLTRISDSLSNSLCRLATGGGFGTRQLYTDDDERLFDAMRPICVTVISEVAANPDLLDRSILNRIDPITERSRRDEQMLWAQYRKARPKILGALLTAASTGLKNLPTTRLERLPRMSDFAKWATAAQSSLCLGAVSFIEAYERNRKAANRLALEVDEVGVAILSFMEQRSEWDGFVGTLLEQLTAHVSDFVAKSPHWPKANNAFKNRLLKLITNLRRDGIALEFKPRAGRGVPVSIRKLEGASENKTGFQPTQPTQPTPETPSAGVGSVGSVGKPPVLFSDPCDSGDELGREGCGPELHDED
jgi:hypothetical protein